MTKERNGVVAVEQNGHGEQNGHQETTALVQASQSLTPATAFLDKNGFELMQRGARLLASSSLVPREYQGNIANCFVALNMALRMQADPLMVMQNLHIIQGRPSWSSQFLIATFNTCGKFSAIRYEWVGKPGTDEWGCRAWAIEKATGEKLVGSLVTIGLAKKEGWYNKQGSKWQTMPEQMLMYRAAAFFVRTYAPEIAMGLHTVEELQDIIDVPTSEYTVQDRPVSDLNARLAADDEPETPPEPDWDEIERRTKAEQARLM